MKKKSLKISHGALMEFVSIQQVKLLLLIPSLSPLDQLAATAHEFQLAFLNHEAFIDLSLATWNAWRRRSHQAAQVLPPPSLYKKAHLHHVKGHEKIRRGSTTELHFHHHLKTISNTFPSKTKHDDNEPYTLVKLLDTPSISFHKISLNST